MTGEHGYWDGSKMRFLFSWKGLSELGWRERDVSSVEGSREPERTTIKSSSLSKVALPTAEVSEDEHDENEGEGWMSGWSRAGGVGSVMDGVDGNAWSPRCEAGGRRGDIEDAKSTRLSMLSSC